MRLRLGVLLLVPSLAIVLLAFVIVSDRRAAHRAALEASDLAETAHGLAELDAALGREAMESALLFEAGPEASAEDLDALEWSREETDHLLAHWEPAVESASAVRSAIGSIEATMAYRSDVTTGRISPLQVADRYGHLRTALLEALSDEATTAGQAGNDGSIVGLISLIEARSAHLDERLAVQLALRYERWAPGQGSSVVSAITVQRSGLELSERHRRRVAPIDDPPDDLASVREQVEVSAELPAISSQEWLAMSDRWLDVLDVAIDDEAAAIGRGFDIAERAAFRSLVFTAVGVTLALAVSTMTAGLISVRLVRRVRLITEQARRLADGRSNGFRFICDSGTDELGQLATAFDETAGRLDHLNRIQALEARVLEAIAEGSDVDDVLELTAQFLGVDALGSTNYRLTREPAEAGVLALADGADIGPIWISPRHPTQARPVPTEVELRRALGFAQMAIRRADGDAQLSELANVDALTGLLNRRAILAEAHRVLDEDGPAADDTAVVFLDLDGFKLINDHHGHPIGDALLIEQAKRLDRAVRPFSGSVGRLGGDEFLAILPRTRGADLGVLIGRLVEVLAQPVLVGELLLLTSASAGAATWRPGVRTEALLQEADAALYEAKRQGKNLSVVSTAQFRAQLAESERRKDSFAKSLERREVVPWFQPIFGRGGSKICGFEALARWESPMSGLLGPQDFLAAARESGLLPRLDAEMLRVVCELVAQWRTHGYLVPPIHINVSTESLGEDGFVERALRTIEDAGCPASCLVVEVTESGLMADIESSAHRLQHLRQAGLRIAADDFGQGYSSLAYLRNLPVDLLKVDRQFVAGIDWSTTNQAIVRAVHNLTSELGLELVVEGVERVEELAHLRAMGEMRMQGFLLGRPIPPEEVARLLESVQQSIRPPAAAAVSV